jgi:MFS family permease
MPVGSSGRVVNAAVERVEAREPSEPYGWYVVFVLCICGIVAFIDRQIINLLVEDIRADLQITDVQISLLQGFAFVIFYATVAIPLGRLADTRNRRWLITIGIVVWTAAAVACGFAETYAQLFVARIFIGIGEAVLTPAGFSLLADYFRPSRLALPISVFTGASFVGSGIALLAGGYLIGLLSSGGLALPFLESREPWQTAFILGASPGLIVAVWFFLTVREPKRRGLADAAADADSASLGAVVSFVRENAGVFVAIFIGLSLLASVQFSLGAWAPAFFIRVHGWTPEQIGYAYGLIFLFFGTGGVVSGGAFADWLHARGYTDANLRTAMLSGLAALPFAVSFAQVDQPWLALALMAPVVGFGTMPFGAGTAVLPIVSPPRYRAQLVAVYLLVANLLGQAGGPWLVAVMTDRVFGSPEAVGQSLTLATGALYLAGAAVIWLGLPSLRRLLGSREAGRHAAPSDAPAAAAPANESAPS